MTTVSVVSALASNTYYLTTKSIESTSLLAAASNSDVSAPVPCDPVSNSGAVDIIQSVAVEGVTALLARTISAQSLDEDTDELADSPDGASLSSGSHDNASLSPDPHEEKSLSLGPHEDENMSSGPHDNASLSSGPHDDENMSSGPHENITSSLDLHEDGKLSSGPHENKTLSLGRHKNKTLFLGPHEEDEQPPTIMLEAVFFLVITKLIPSIRSEGWKIFTKENCIIFHTEVKKLRFIYPIQFLVLSALSTTIFFVSTLAVAPIFTPVVLAEVLAWFFMWTNWLNLLDPCMYWGAGLLTVAFVIAFLRIFPSIRRWYRSCHGIAEPITDLEAAQKKKNKKSLSFFLFNPFHQEN